MLKFENVLLARPVLADLVQAACRGSLVGFEDKVDEAFKGLTAEQEAYFATLIASVYSKVTSEAKRVRAEKAEAKRRKAAVRKGVDPDMPATASERVAKYLAEQAST